MVSPTISALSFSAFNMLHFLIVLHIKKRNHISSSMM
ncbi:hypothetical protein Golob_019412 [Gossypium lobatum]|uniref:Uncharacterized protein n=1 Tax=Gossypium lobatum TaxID=34289 RepID=A0A7J8L781_9ROSI|nr:hypothetical protein [Gossypium lobatum]